MAYFSGDFGYELPLRRQKADSSQLLLCAAKTPQEKDVSKPDISKTSPISAGESSRNTTTHNEAIQRTELDELPQEQTFWYRRRQEGYEGLNRDDPAVWSLYTRETESIHMVSTLVSKALVSLKEWILEFLALILSILSFTAIVVLLATYDGEVQPGFADRISVSALIAIFSTILRATVLFIVSELIGDSKWQWMESPRSVRDMEYFINAGAGPWGSLKFLFFSWKPIWTVVGAFVVIASTAIGPFSQQASTTYTCTRPVGGTARIALAQNMSETMDLEIEMVAIGGLMYKEVYSSVNSTTLIKCLDEACRFNRTDDITYASIGICSSCTEGHARLEEVVPFLNSTGSHVFNSVDSPDAQWPSGIDNAYAIRSKVVFEPMPELEDFENETAPRFVADSMRGANTTVVIRALTRTSDLRGVQSYRTGGGARLGLLAMECAIFPCLKRYTGEVVNGKFTENVVSEIPMTLVLGPRSTEENDHDGNEYHGEFIQILKPCYTKSDRYEPWIFAGFGNANYPITDWKDYISKSKLPQFPTPCLGRIGHLTYGNVQKLVEEALTGSCNVSRLGSPPSLRAPAEISCQGYPSVVDNIFMEGSMSFASVSAAFDGMASSITNLMRVREVYGTNVLISGFTNKAAICIQVYWAWLFYPAAVLALTTLLFIRTCLQSNMNKRQRPVWKSNVLPLVFYDIATERDRSDGEAAQRDVKVPLLTLAELGAVANHTVVWFDNEADAPGFITKAGENSLKNVLVDLKENGVSALSKKEQVRAREKSKASGIVNFRTWLCRRRETGDGTEL